MRIASVRIAGFRSFGPDAKRIDLAGNLTAIVGPNASGKTAMLQALQKVFGVTRAQRTLHRSDFHLPADVAPGDRTARDLVIDIVVSIPELIDGSATAETIAPTFRHMQIKQQKAAPVCRLRLEGHWEDDSTADGEVTQELFWVDHLDDEVEQDDKHVVSPADRGLVQFYYTPATRDAEAQIRVSTGALAARLLRAIEWSKGTRETVEAATRKLSDAFDSEAAISRISRALGKRWKELHEDATETDPALRLVSKRFEDVVAHIEVMFRHGSAQIERGLDVLSDGQQSLFYFALAAAVFDLERAAAAGKIKGFLSDELRIPALTIFGIEEPENHLSPYYLSRIVRQIRSIVRRPAAQAVITSHSPSVLSRVEPTEVRYCRRDSEAQGSTVVPVELPKDASDAAKFVRGAMLAYPELYFARFVILVEGESERIVLPQLAQAQSLVLDPSFVAVVPLGGRHVRHFWRLLKGLSIPHATLLDLDLGRSGGGFGRVKNIVYQLLSAGWPRREVLGLSNGRMLSDSDLRKMHTWDNVTNLNAWVDDLKNYGVYFSKPLDLDMSMLASFPDAYEAIIPKRGGPSQGIDDAAVTVLGTGGKGLDAYKGTLAKYKEHMPAYLYHFLTRSKPATHLLALSRLDDRQLAKGMPKVYRDLVRHIDRSIKR